ncbi:MAG: hypothetical protein K1X53_16525, partial [Candidatus Sumerlaeaceae bacterium]|nr:hypothetical protein [Candidatus Sumerlaeaceae bacterium]
MHIPSRTRHAIAAGLVAAASTLILALAPAARAAEFRLISPRNAVSTSTKERISIAGHAVRGAAPTVTVGGVDVPVFHTNIFQRDGVPLAPGLNTIVITQNDASGKTTASTTLQITRVEATPTVRPPAARFPVTINADSAQPSQDLALAPGDDLEVSFRGAAGHRASVTLSGIGTFPMEEVAPADETSTAPTGQYRATLTMPRVSAETSSTISVKLESDTPDPASPGTTPTAELKLSAGITLLPNAGPPRLLRVSANRGVVRFGLTEVRLNGPNLAELPKGTILRAVGKQGRDYKIRLSPALDAWISAGDVEPAPAGTALPHIDFTDMTITPGPDGDTINIPYEARIPFAVNADPIGGPNGMPVVNIDLYGAHNAVTWITHRNPGSLIRQVTSDQQDTNHLRLRAELTTAPLWGYKAEVTTSALKVTIRRPPTLAPAPQSPLKGLTIAVNAGHGGRE